MIACVILDFVQVVVCGCVVGMLFRVCYVIWMIYLILNEDNELHNMMRVYRSLSIMYFIDYFLTVDKQIICFIARCGSLSFPSPEHGVLHDLVKHTI